MPAAAREGTVIGLADSKPRPKMKMTARAMPVQARVPRRCTITAEGGVAWHLAPAMARTEFSKGMSVLIELSKIITSEMQDRQLIWLKEVDGERKFTIVIGPVEAMAIDRRLKGASMPRPMTHDLLATIVEAMGGKLEKIEINDLQ